MHVTIFTDGAWSDPDEHQGYAFWISCGQFEIKRAGHFKYEHRILADGAEIVAIMKAMEFLVKEKELVKLKSLTVYTDSTTCIGWFKQFCVHFSSKHKAVNKLGRKCTFLMVDLLYKNGMTMRDYSKFFKFIHVRAHTQEQDVASLKNNWCDINAKKFKTLTDFSEEYVHDLTDVIF